MISEIVNFINLFNHERYIWHSLSKADKLKMAFIDS